MYCGCTIKRGEYSSRLSDSVVGKLYVEVSQCASFLTEADPASL